MREKRDYQNRLTGGNNLIPNSELNDNQENGESENEGNHFYLLIGDEKNDLSEVIRKWESIRFGM
jgi:hypothetical protein